MRRQLGAYVTFGIPLRNKMVSQAWFAIIIFRQQITGYLRPSTGFDELQPSAVEKYHFSTMDYCTMKLAPTAAKLTVLFSCNLGREEKLLSTVSQYTPRTMAGTFLRKESAIY